MHWPGTPVEHLSGFQPAFCPRRGCPEHLRLTPGFRFERHGFYSTRRRWRIPRFRCLRCGASFSRQTYAVSYYSKRPELLIPIAAGLVGGSAHRQIARTLGCAPSTVTRNAARLGRHAILMMALARGELAGLAHETFVFDHFETFEFTQDYQFGVGTLVGSKSWFVYDLDPAPHGRTGHISPAQRHRLELRPRRQRYGGYVGSSRRVFERLRDVTLPGTTITIIGDGHKAYDRAVRDSSLGRAIVLESYPNPERGPKGSPRSEAARIRDERMFPIDLLHKILRHSLAHQRRETIAFGRRLNAVMEQMFLTAVWRNFVKKRSERISRSGTPAMHLGLTRERWPWSRVFSRRLFPARIATPPLWAHLYRRLWTSPLYKNNTRHQLKLAF
jgi:transposase-like protein